MQRSIISSATVAASSSVSTRGKDHYHYDSDYHGDNYDNSIKNYSKDNSHLNWGNTIAYGRWNYVFNSKLFCNTTVSYNKYEMGLDGNIEDTYTVANKVQDRYYYSSKFNSGIRDWSARMDFDYIPHAAAPHQVRCRVHPPYVPSGNSYLAKYKI